MLYNEQLDKLFSRWISTLNDEQKSLFCKDGLMIKFNEPATSVDEKWEKAKRRVMFLLKDKNTPDGDDTRLWMIDPKYGEQTRNLSGGRVGKTGFMPNLARIFFGLLKTEKDVRYGFSEVLDSHMDAVRQAWNSEPFAFVEAKKLAGFSSVDSKDVLSAMEHDKELLIEEIKILQPNVIVCCDADDSQFTFVTQKYLEGKAPIKIEYSYPAPRIKPCCLWYYPSEKIAVIKSYHPSRLGKADWMIYERVISPFHKLIQNINI